ncbi:uncharacterized protein LOC109518896 isoform X3 [Hippocampus comes]|uniref:uncharacterized protein LOC109518896 isoform X3 n=1 Tax=Hippocampus comes TaxID=109280 RepID=UPI00094F04DC|nr:PREDICTED: uncharacterized protein LOC109518896 isoform X3 [Hippocampus comes]
MRCSRMIRWSRIGRPWATLQFRHLYHLRHLRLGLPGSCSSTTPTCAKAPENWIRDLQDLVALRRPDCIQNSSSTTCTARSPVGSQPTNYAKLAQCVRESACTWMWACLCVFEAAYASAHVFVSANVDLCVCVCVCVCANISSHQRPAFLVNASRVAGVSSKVFCELCKCPPRISASFFGRLPQVVRVARRSLMELHPFSQAPPSVCAFQRGRSVNNTHGRYTATITGFYLLSARLRLKSSERVQVRLHESVKAAICVESLCHTKLSIESVVGVASVGADFSITLTGTLFLQAGEYASVYVDNATGANISVLPESFFSTILLGS